MKPDLDRVIVALDTPDLKRVEALLKELDGLVTYYKIGLELFTAHGWKVVEQIKKRGNRVFLDLKLHDIPHTVAKTAEEICRHDVDLFNVHALGGLEMMRRAREAVDKAPSKKKPRLIAVTILTSHNEAELQHELGIQRPLEDEVTALANLAVQAGLAGVVCSPLEIALIRKTHPQNFLIVTPGIRPETASSDDQKRTLSAREAFQQGADFIVIGRPITGAPSARMAAESLLKF